MIGTRKGGMDFQEGKGEKEDLRRKESGSVKESVANFPDPFLTKCGDLPSVPLLFRFRNNQLVCDGQKPVHEFQEAGVVIVPIRVFIVRRIG